MLHLTGQAGGLVAVGTKRELDAGVEWCKTTLIEILGSEDGASAFHFLPALEGLIFFKAKDRRALAEWARQWKDSLT